MHHSKTDTWGRHQNRRLGDSCQYLSNLFLLINVFTLLKLTLPLFAH